MENKNVSYAVFEGVQIRHERTLKRLIIALSISVILMFATNALWLYAWCQYDYSSEQSTVTVEQDAKDGGNANYIGNDGDIANGVSESNENNTQENTD
jgi:hypothetical protein